MRAGCGGTARTIAEGFLLETTTLHSRHGQAFLAAIVLALSLVLLPACTSNSYAGIAFAPSAADPALQALARRAEAGDKQAQLALGIRYEEGDGVPVDLDRARDLYRLAANDSGGPLYAYQPAVGNAPARVTRIADAPVQPGLEEARRRLEGVKQGGFDGMDGEISGAAFDSDNDEQITVSNEAIESRFRTIIAMLGERRSQEIDALAQRIVDTDNLEFPYLRSQILEFRCPPEPSMVPGILLDMACPASSQQVIVIQIWDEIFALGGVFTTIRGNENCMTVGGALGHMQRQGWSSQPIFSAPMERSREDDGVIPLGRIFARSYTFVTVSPNKDIVYVPRLMNNECLSSIFIMLGLY